MSNQTIQAHNQRAFYQVKMQKPRTFLKYEDDPNQIRATLL